MGDTLYSVAITRADAKYRVVLSPKPPVNPGLTPARSALQVNLVPAPPVEFEFADDLGPQPGDATHLPHIADEHYQADRTTFTLYAQAGTSVGLRVRRNGILERGVVSVRMPPGTGYVSRSITLRASGPLPDQP